MYEQGVIRPPSEAESLLVRVTRNCPWNQCVFCPAYKGVKFSKRSVEEVKKDIDAMADQYRGHGRISSVFLQDADSLVLPTDDVVAILEYLREKFPKIERITTYARARTLKRKSVEDLKRLKEAGLTRVHAGMESGATSVLQLIKKGLTQEEIVTGGRHVMDAGLELSEYIMPGIGGKSLSEEHARETASLLNQIKPDFIRVRTFAMHPASPMQKMVREGTFVPMSDDEIVGEIRLLVENLRRDAQLFLLERFQPEPPDGSRRLPRQGEGVDAENARYLPCLFEEGETDIYPTSALRLLPLSPRRGQGPDGPEPGAAEDRGAGKGRGRRVQPVHRPPEVISAPAAADG